MRKLSLVMLVAAMSFIPMTVQGGENYERTVFPKQQTIWRANTSAEMVPYPTSRPCRERHTTISDPPCYERVEIPPRAEVTYYVAKPCGERTSYAPCRKKNTAARTCPKLDLKKLERLSVKLQRTARELEATQKRERVNFAERQKKDIRLATLEEWVRNYREQYKKHDGWKGLHK